MMSLIQLCSAVRIPWSVCQVVREQNEITPCVFLPCFFSSIIFSLWSSYMVLSYVSKKLFLLACVFVFCHCFSMKMRFSGFFLVLWQFCQTCFAFLSSLNSGWWAPVRLFWDLSIYLKLWLVCVASTWEFLGWSGCGAALWCGRSLPLFRDSQMMSLWRASGPCNYRQCPIYGSGVHVF